MATNLAGIRGMVQGMIGRGAGAAGAGRGASHKVLTGTDLKAIGSITCGANVWTTIGSYSVTPQTTMQVGLGRAGSPNVELGVFYGTLGQGGAGTNTTITTGKLRVLVQDSEGRTRGYTAIDQVDVSRVNQSYTNRDTRYIVPVNGPVAREDDQIIVQYNPGATATTICGNTTNSTYTTIYLDCTLFS